jgi:hypothetical protein
VHQPIDIEALCAQRGLRITEQRRVIARVLSESTDHPDVEKLYERASVIDPGISIATAMGRLIEEPKLRELSLARGRELLATLGWEPAARAVVEELTTYPPACPGRAVAAVGVLPPAHTAIAACTIDHLQSSGWRTDFFDANPGPTLAADQQLLAGNRILPVEVLLPALASGDHGTVVFVLGNSEHHVKVLRAAMQTRLGCRQRARRPPSRHSHWGLKLSRQQWVGQSPSRHSRSRLRLGRRQRTRQPPHRHSRCDLKLSHRRWTHRPRSRNSSSDPKLSRLQ